MKKQLIYALSLVTGLFLSLVLTSCSDDDKKSTTTSEDAAAILAAIDAADQLEYNSSNAINWKAYMNQVATLLAADATTLYNEWYNSYANEFKSAGAGSTEFNTAKEATLQILGGCSDIANEVGEAKIGDPVNLWNSGKYEEAVYAVESWYSYHSRIDYSNNIISIRNAYRCSLDGSVGVNSLSAKIAATNPSLDNSVNEAINDAIDAILAIPQPFRSHLFSSEAQAAIAACANLNDLITGDLTNAVNALSEADCMAINQDYVDIVVMPTYLALKNANNALKTAVANFNGTSFNALAAAWEVARTPWEQSEAFLFGPVADLGLDPNMDSWPLDRSAINGILENGDFSGMNWDGPYDENSESIAEAQSIRGFHTLEYLVFKQGNPRSIN